MGRGLITGVIWGTLFSIFLLAVISLNAPLPERAETASTAAVPETGMVDTGADTAADAPEAPADGGDVATSADATDLADTPADAAMPGDGAAPDQTADAPADAAAPAMTATVDPAPTAPVEDTGLSDNASTSAGGLADAVPLPAGSEFNRPPTEQEAALPRADTAPAGRLPQVATAPEAPEAAGANTSPAPQPTAGQASNLPQVTPPTADSPQLEVASTEADPLAPPPALQPAPLGLPQVDTGPGTQTASAPAPSPPTAADTDAAETSAPEATMPAPAAEPAPAPRIIAAPRLPTIGDGTAAPAPAIGGDETATDGGTFTDPPSDTSMAGAITPDVMPDIAADMPTDPVADDRPAIEAFAAPFDPAEDRPLLAVILIDDPAFGLDREVLRSFPFPVSFAIDPTRPQAAQNAAEYRAAGFEVLILAGMLPEGAAPADVEVALEAARIVLPEAVALIDSDDNRVQGDRPVLDAVLAALAETGHGLVAYPRGLNAGEQSAGRLGVPAATLFRQIDAERERATVITRYLDRAAFAAGQDGTAIVIGHTYADTVTALFSWALGTRSESVAIAPVSAVLQR